ncbi:MAG: hypothetical protein KC609_15895 [Myxococcales bacterium]|nr:hypothetical protein [Myxococcales bacterium]
MAGVSRSSIIETNFRAAIEALRGDERAKPSPDDRVRAGSSLTFRRALEIFTSQLYSRYLDLCARELKNTSQSFYTIGSSGHEANAAVAAVTQNSDLALLHYRSGAFYLQRGFDHFGRIPLDDVLLGLVASKEEPIAGGRHKVFGRRELNIPPQTSTIASHLPRAVGCALMLDRRGRRGRFFDAPKDAIVICSFGDASLNHHSAVGAINTALWAAHQNLPVPLLLVCEDNGLGISVPTPEGWIATQYHRRPELRYRHADGRDLAETYDVAREAVELTRRTRRPVFLHLTTVRLLGHAGSDVEQSYRSAEEIAASESADPLVASARLLIESGFLSADDALAFDARVREHVFQRARWATERPKLTTADEVIAPLAPLDDSALASELSTPRDPEARRRFWGARLPEDDRPRHLARLVNYALGDLLANEPRALIFGEDVAKKGGVYNVTQGLLERAGAGRVFNTLLDEENILGLALGAGLLGYLPVPEIQYLAYLHNAIDQLRGEACSQQFFSQGQYSNPMIVRIASYAYQRGFGGHFHNENAVASLRDIPGLLIASPSRGEDAVGMLRTCTALAKRCGRVIAFLEPIALYMTRDLHDEGDGLWSDAYPGPDFSVPLGRARVYGDGTDITILSFANGLYMSLRVTEKLRRDAGIDARVVDLRWLNPLPLEDLLAEANATGRVLIVDETRRSGGVSEAIVTALVDAGYGGTIERICSLDSYIPLGAAANLVLVSEARIAERIEAIVGRGSRRAALV